MTIEHRWSPIEPLTAEEQAMDLGLQPLIQAWYESQVRLEESSQSNVDDFKERLRRRWSVETGILERLYDVDRGITEQLVKQGFVEDLIAGTSPGMEPGRLIHVLRDHENGYNLLMEWELYS